MKSCTKYIVVCLIVVGSLAIGTPFLWPSTAQQSQAPTTPDEGNFITNQQPQITPVVPDTVKKSDMEALASRLNHLEDTLESLIQEIRAVKTQNATHVDEVETLTDRMNKEAKDQPNNIALIEERFGQEPADPQWEMGIEADISKAIEEHGINDVVLDQIQCHQTACRLELMHTEVEVATDSIVWMHVAEPFISSEFHVQSVIDDDGSQKTLIYLSLPGQSLFNN